MQRRACREGNHAFGAETSVGAGLRRHRCKYCGAITIDLCVAGNTDDDTSTEADDPSQAVAPPALFRRGPRVTIFDIEQVVSAGLLEPDDDPAAS